MKNIIMLLQHQEVYINMQKNEINLSQHLIIKNNEQYDLIQTHQ